MVLQKGMKAGASKQTQRFPPTTTTTAATACTIAPAASTTSAEPTANTPTEAKTPVEATAFATVAAAGLAEQHKRTIIRTGRVWRKKTQAATFTAATARQIILHDLKHLDPSNI